VTPGTLPSIGHSGIQADLRTSAPRERTLSILETIEAIATRENADPIRHRLLDLRQRVEQDRFQLAVVGQFKRGKTSVLNALLRGEVLPSGALPLTSVLTMVKHGDRQIAEVLFQSGRRLAIPISSLLEYVTEAGNPHNTKCVEHVEVSYPSEFLRGGVTLVNCPGFGSPSGRNTHTAYEFLPRIDAAIFVTSPDPPLTLAEVEFLRTLAGSTKRIFVAMNKVDLLSATSLDAVLEFTRNAVSVALGNSIPVYPVSALQILDQVAQPERSVPENQGFHDLELDLQHCLKEERHNVFYTSILGNLVNSISDLRVHLQLRLESAVASSHDFEAKRLRLEDEISATLQRQQQNEASLRATVSHFSAIVETETVTFAESRVPILCSTLRAYIKNGATMSKRDLAASLDPFIGLQTQDILDQWRPDFESSLIYTLRDAFAGFLKATKDATDSFQDSAFALSGAEPKSFQIIEEPPVIENCERAKPVLLRGQEWPSLFLPGPVFRWRALKIALKAAPLELELAGRLVARDLKSCLHELTDVLTNNVRNHVNEIVEATRLAAGERFALHGNSATPSGERSRLLSTDIANLDRISELLHVDLGADFAFGG